MKKLLTQYGGLKREIYILFIGKLVTAMGSFVWPMLTFFLTPKLGLSDGTATILIATATILTLPAALLGGKLADRFSRKSIIIIFDCLTVFFYVLASILPISYFTAVVIFLAALFQTIEGPAYDALNADFSSSKQRERAYSLSYLGFNLGFIVGASVAGILFQNHVRLAFLLNGVAILISTLLIIFFVHMKNAIRDDDSTEEGFGEYEKPVDDKLSVLKVLKDRAVVAMFLIVGCLAPMGTVMGIVLPLQLKQAMGEAGAALYGALSSLNGFVVIQFTPILTMLLRRLTEIPKAIIGMLFFVGGIALFSTGNVAAILFAGMFVFTLGEVTTVLGYNPYPSRRVPASHRGRVGGVLSVIASVLIAAIQYGIGIVLTVSGNDYRLIWLAFVAVGLVVAVVYGLLYRSDKRMFPKLYE